ncbi:MULTISPECIES: HPr family phosphocarrier protein [unclassified Butyrivibrio]|uniref:HPr family phosphocarrier protein n=1 Tax=unclassified Butyrivibrio TaxID=2639466 RepID=UPI0003B578A7|nr:MULTISPECIES: HPr family phosphocarrier protein [unclassified Butyrivibrio]MDC7292375.1 HPr family phosphocarrier protein [Butyrivibrio sp. DSM 10294]
MITKSIEIKLPRGLEARPVAELVQLASKYESTMHIEAQSKKVNAKSIMGMMTLNLNTGEEVTVIAEGSDEETAVADLEKFLQGNAQ